MAGRLENKVALVLVLPVLAPISGGSGKRMRIHPDLVAKMAG